MPPLPPPQRTLLTLPGLSLSDLPPPSAPASVLTPFLTTLLAEAIPLVDSVPSPNTTTTPNKPPTNPPYKWTTLSASPKSYPPTSTAPVHLSSLTTTTTTTATPEPPKKEKETWIARLSIHTDAPHAGTASFSEFQTFIKSQHVDTEASCTPSVDGVWRGGRWMGCDSVVRPFLSPLPPPLQPNRLTSP